MLVILLSVLSLLKTSAGDAAIITVPENGFWIQDVRGRQKLIVAGKIEDTAYIQFYDGEKQIAEIKNSVSSYAIVLDNTRCTSTGLQKHINNFTFNWIWITWDNNKITVGPGKVPDGWGTSRLDFGAIPTTAVFLSHAGKSEWKFDVPVLYQNMYTKTEGRRGGEVGEKIKTVSVLACISRCTQDNKCAAANFSPNNGEGENCEIISYRAKFAWCNKNNPHKLTGLSINTGDPSWNLYVKQ